MTEKRFTLIKDTEWWFVQDNTIQVNEFGYREDLTGEDAYRGLGQELTEQETVDLLNDLNNENKSFKAEIEHLKKCYNNALNEMDTLAEVNDKTYKENKDLEEARSYYQENFLTMKTERNQLKKENKELKQEVEVLKMEIAELRESESDNYNISDGLW